MQRFRCSVTILGVLSLPAMLLGQNATGQTGSYFLRGKVTAIQSDQVTVAPRSGGTPVTVPLVKGWTATVINPADERIVKVGNIVNIVEVDQPDGVSHALFVDYLASRNAPPGTSFDSDIPPSTVPEGRAWSQLPGSDQFGAWGTLGKIISVEKTANGMVVVTQLPEGLHKSLVSSETVMVRNDRSPQSVVKVGENVAVILRKGPEGKPMANRILVGGKGTIPPM